jgi:hypothetical protein
MAHLTKDQARTLADQLDNCATTINKFRNDNAASLKSEEKQNLDREVARLLNRSAELRREAARIMFSDLQKSLTEIKSATDGLESALVRIDNAGKCINYAAKLVTLAGAICTGNAVTIGTAAAGILSSLKADGVIA